MTQEEMTKQITEAIHDASQEIAITIENVFGPIRDMYEMDFMNRWNEQKKNKK